jgi:hypothetical protein
MVTVLQFCENLTDRQAADEARGRVDWKYCLSLELATSPRPSATRPMTTQTPAGPRPRPWHDNLEASGLLPGEHAADSGYVSADLLVSCRLRGITLLGPCLRPGPGRWLHRGHVHHRLGPPPGHLPARRGQQRILEWVTGIEAALSAWEAVPSSAGLSPDRLARSSQAVIVAPLRSRPVARIVLARNEAVPRGGLES